MSDLKEVKLYDLVEEIRRRGMRVDHPLYEHPLISSYPKICKLIIELYCNEETTKNALDRLHSGFPADFLKVIEDHIVLSKLEVSP